MKACTISLSTALVVATLTGCAAVRYEPISYDSPKPALEGVRGCLSPGALAPGGECLALVRADQWWSDTGVRVQKDAAYRLTVCPHQVWFDKGRVNVPPNGESGNAVMDFFARYKRHPEGLWFSLIAAVVEEPGSGFDRREHQRVDIGAASKKNRDSVIFIAQEDGALSLYPNDARGPASHPTLFYENNSGQIWVRVRWLTAKEASTATVTGVANECRPLTNPTVAR